MDLPGNFKNYKQLNCFVHVDTTYVWCIYLLYSMLNLSESV